MIKLSKLFDNCFSVINTLRILRNIQRNSSLNTSFHYFKAVWANSLLRKFRIATDCRMFIHKGKEGTD